MDTTRALLITIVFCFLTRCRVGVAARRSFGSTFSRILGALHDILRTLLGTLQYTACLHNSTTQRDASRQGRPRVSWKGDFNGLGRVKARHHSSFRAPSGPLSFISAFVINSFVVRRRCAAIIHSMCIHDPLVASHETMTMWSHLWKPRGFGSCRWVLSRTGDAQWSPAFEEEAEFIKSWHLTPAHADDG